jgi:transcriptional regulator with XRE-family HTH domain
VSALSKRLGERKVDLGLSIQALADKATADNKPINKATIYKYLNDEAAQVPPEPMVRALAIAFEISEGEIRTLSRVPRGEREPWVPPEESARLSREQRIAIENLIKAIVRRPDEHEVTQPLAEVVELTASNDTPADVARKQQVGEDVPEPSGKSRGRATRPKKRKKDTPANAPAEHGSEDRPL